ncbi:hypothetical protein [Pseudomonas sichuanensis]|uniref:hypothetical protein n=1 Tax=Pseudomonas sichuanensis TaxID=2213015 RepID=UPI00215FCE7F|nr:hypothetical protein [Pseudomonas sichuanensis]UVL91487.1 hypothetical protein LOY51_11640 [Pseudomonas sichuanensis]
MTKVNNHVVWGAPGELVSAYKLLDENGDLVPDLESQTVAKRAQVAKYDFFFRKGLLLVNPFDQNGELIEREYRVNDFSEVGYELCRKKIPAWLRGKGSKKNPPDMSLLEKALVEMAKQ